jgi:hypothetical protein
MKSRRIYLPVYGIAVILTIVVIDYWIYRGTAVFTSIMSLVYLAVIWGSAYLVMRKIGQKSNDAA